MICWILRRRWDFPGIITNFIYLRLLIFALIGTQMQTGSQKIWSTNGWYQRLSVLTTRRIAIINIRHFTQYLNATGKRAYVPSSEYNVRARRYQPYIFRGTELSRLFDEIDSLKNRKGYETSKPNLILLVAFRLELCCGMRPAEPFNLRVDDVNLKTGGCFHKKGQTRERPSHHHVGRYASALRRLWWFCRQTRVFFSIYGRRKNSYSLGAMEFQQSMEQDRSSHKD